MPLYEYDCGRCGGFSAWGTMAGSGLPAICPDCGAAADRVLSATAFAGGRARPPAGEPRLVQRRVDGPLAPAHAPHGHGGRPWMMGH
jgi:putative FmdB family regulatory protein